MRKAGLVALGLGLIVSVAGAAQSRYGLLPSKPDSDERRAPIGALKGQAPALAARFASGVYRSPKGEEMPYRLFTPAGLEAGRSYPLVVFLHGASGGGTDNARRLEGGNLYGALVWAVPENQAKHPAFVLAPQSVGVHRARAR